MSERAAFSASISLMSESGTEPSEREKNRKRPTFGKTLQSRLFLTEEDIVSNSIASVALTLNLTAML